MGMVNSGDWRLNEEPVAYLWDPESQRFFESLNLNVKIKESYYSSIHYVVKSGNDERIKCEIQVRTLFEEIWGEIDHTINYPKKSTSRATKEQLRVLSKLVSTGTRLADSIFRLDDADRQP
jgi:putative GTP pyrophosphokinase